MCKRILTIAAVVVAVSGLALADNTATVDQDAATDNQVLIIQAGSGNEVVINQLARTGYNFAGWQANSDLIQWGNNNKVDVDQDAYTDNQLMIYQRYNRNKVVGATWNSGAIDENAAARQVSTGSYNYMGILSVGYDNKVGLNMWATAINEAYTWQDGSRNKIGLSLYARGGNNLIGGNVTYPLRDGIIQDGDDNLVWLNLDAGTDNTVTYAKQIGNNNKLVGAGVNAGKAAYQYAGTGYNQLDSTQTGDWNEIGLYQYAGTNNDATITQTGGDTATICQIAGGFNIATVTQ